MICRLRSGVSRYDFVRPGSGPLAADEGNAELRAAQRQDAWYVRNQMSAAERRT